MTACGHQRISPDRFPSSADGVVDVEVVQDRVGEPAESPHHVAGGHPDLRDVVAAHVFGVHPAGAAHFREAVQHDPVPPGCLEHVVVGDPHQHPVHVSECFRGLVEFPGQVRAGFQDGDGGVTEVEPVVGPVVGVGDHRDVRAGRGLGEGVQEFAEPFGAAPGGDHDHQVVVGQVILRQACDAFPCPCVD